MRTLLGACVLAVAFWPACSIAQEAALTKSARAALPSVPTSELEKRLKSGLWNSNKTAVALTAQDKVWVFLKQADGQYLAVDISGVEAANLGKLGTGARAAYERIETTPVAWLERPDGMFQVLVRTRAWKSGQRYTTEEPLVLFPSGKVLWR